MADDRLGLQPARGDEVEQRPHVRLHVAPARAEGERPLPHVEVWKVPDRVVRYADHRDRASALDDLHRRFDSRQDADTLDAPVDSEAAGVALDRLDRVRLFGVDRYRAHPLRELEPAADHVDVRDPPRSEELPATDA